MLSAGNCPCDAAGSSCSGSRGFSRMAILLLQLTILVLSQALSAGGSSSNSAPEISRRSFLYTDSGISPTVEPSAFPSAFPTENDITLCDLQVDEAMDRVAGTAKWYRKHSTSRLPSLSGDWHSFVVDLQNMQLRAFPTEFIHVSSGEDCHEYDQLHLNEIHVNYCSDRSAVSLLWSSLLNGIPASAKCDHNLWRSATAPNGDFIITINGSRSAAGFAVGVNTENYTSTWPEWAQTAVAHETNITVGFSLLHVGQIQCAAFLASDAPLSTPLSILQSPNHVQSTRYDYFDLQGEMVIRGLQPSTAYNVYCYTEGLWAALDTISRPPVAVTLSMASSVVTLDRMERQMMVTIPFTSWARGSVSPSVSVSPSFSSQNITVVPELHFLGSDYCRYDGETRQPLHLSASISAVVAPYSLAFGGAVSRDVFFVQMLRQGCYALSFYYFANEHTRNMSISTVINTPRGQVVDVAFINSTVDTAANVYMQSACFSHDGLRLEVRFSTSTDSGASIQLPASFSCDLILEFPGANASSCWFETNTLLKATLPTESMVLPMVNDMVSLLPEVLRPLCTLPSGASCTQPVEDFVQSSSVPISAEKGPFPKAVVTAPPQVPVGSDLTLDISPSWGNGGREWASIRWTVMMNYTEDFVLQSLQNYMNNGSMLWTNCATQTHSCDTIPASLLTMVGVYNFRLFLTNFVGRVASTALSIQVVDQPYVPSVHIYGPSLVTVATNVTNVIRAVPQVDGKHCPVTELSWLVYENEVVSPRLASDKSAFRDVRTLAFDPYVLKPGYAYRIGVTLLCGAHSAYSEVTRLVEPCEVIAQFRNGNSQTVSLANPLVIDASGSYISCTQNFDLVYQWSCVQRFPLNSTGCHPFYVAMQAHNLTSSATIALESPGSVFQAGAIYIITVRATSRSLGITNQVSQTLTTLAGSGKMVPALSVATPAIVIDGSYRHTIDGYVRSASAVLAEWKMIATNETLISRVLQQGSNHYFPAVVQPRLLLGRNSFVFRLRAMAISNTCSDFSCADASAIATTSVRVTVNQPPSSGYLFASPSHGGENTLFSISALNWQDENLPLFYAFYQSSNHSEYPFNLIRHRMQLPHMSSTLTRSHDMNDTVVLRVFVVDTLFARAEAFRQVTVNSSSAHNVTAVIRATSRARITSAAKSSPEVVLPSLSSLVSFAQNCTDGLEVDSDYCKAVSTSGSTTLRAAMDKYNAGFYTIAGLSSYLKSFSAINPDDAVTSTNDLLDVYAYLLSSIVSVGFRTSDGTEVIYSLLESCDALVTLLNLNGTQSSFAPRGPYFDALAFPSAKAVKSSSSLSSSMLLSSENPLHRLLETINSLSARYFQTFPFGYAQSLGSSQFFNVSMQKGYWEDADSSERGAQLAESLRLNGDIFPSGTTSTYSSLLVSIHAQFELGNKTIPVNVLRSHYVEFSVSSSEREIPAELVIGFDDVPTELKNRRRLQATPAVILRACNETDSPVTCTPEQTNGPAFTFPLVSCSDWNASMLSFSCPLYTTGLVCAQTESEDVWPAEITNSSALCRYPVILSNATRYSSFSSLLSNGSYYLGTATETLSESSITPTHKSPTSEPAWPPMDSAEGMSYLAIIGISVAGIVFAVFLYYRIKASASLGSNFNSVVARTSAEYVQSVPVASVDTECPEECKDVPIVDTEVLRIEFHAVAHCLAESRPDPSNIPLAYQAVQIDQV